MRRASIDAAFAEMADDSEYQAEALRLSAEFAVADWEAFRATERAQRATVDVLSDPKLMAQIERSHRTMRRA